MSKRRLEGKRALVTGAGSGLGAAMAVRFVEEGARVLLTDLDLSGAEAVVAGLPADRRSSAAARKLDVTREDEVAAAVADVVARWGALDILVANAGIGSPGLLADLPLAEWQRVLEVNLTGVFLCCRHAFRAMRSSGGSILVTSSVAGLHGTAGLGAYGPSKAAVLQLVETLALEGARHQIRANALCPGWTESPMVDAFVRGMGVSAEEGRRRLLHDIPLRRLGRPEDVAAAATFLVSDEAAFVTGVALPVDGGHMAGRAP